MTEPNIVPVLVICTLHLPNHDSLDNEEARQLLSVDPTTHGWLVYVPGEGDIDEPEWIRDIFKFARSLGCKCILFDCDEDPMEQLPIYDW